MEDEARLLPPLEVVDARDLERPRVGTGGSEVGGDGGGRVMTRLKRRAALLGCCRGLLARFAPQLAQQAHLGAVRRDDAQLCGRELARRQHAWSGFGLGLELGLGLG